MYDCMKFLIWQFCCIALALSQIFSDEDFHMPEWMREFPPKHPVPANSSDPRAKFNGVVYEDLPEWFISNWYDQRCFDCCPPIGEYVRYELQDDGKEDCSTGRDEWVFNRSDPLRKIFMGMLSPKCLPTSKDIAQVINATRSFFTDFKQNFG